MSHLEYVVVGVLVTVITSCIALPLEDGAATFNSSTIGSIPLNTPSPVMITFSTVPTTRITSVPTTLAVTPAIVEDNLAKYLTAMDLPPCQQSDEKLGDCIKHAIEIILPRLRNGNKELNIPPVDPFQLNKTTFQYANGAVNGRIIMRNAEVHGFADLQIKSVEMKANKEKIKMRLRTYVPQIEINGNYKADMSFNNARVRPRGAFNVTLVDLDMEQQADGVFYEKDGHRFVHLLKFDVDPKIGDLKINANGIFPDPTLNELILNVANQYWSNIYRIMLPETRQYWAPMLLRVLNEALSVVPFDAYVKVE